MEKLEKHSFEIGKVHIDDKKIKIAHKEGMLIVGELQLPNKKRMQAQALLNGFTFENGAEVL